LAHRGARPYRALDSPRTRELRRFRLPDGLRGEAIPLASRILLVADAFDAITSTRPYRQARSVADAREELMRHAGRQFDPACVRALLDHLDGLEHGEGGGAGTGADLRTADAATAPPRLAP